MSGPCATVFERRSPLSARDSSSLSAELGLEPSLQNSDQNDATSPLKQTRQQPSARKASWISARRS